MNRIGDSNFLFCVLGPLLHLYPNGRPPLLELVPYMVEHIMLTCVITCRIAIMCKDKMGCLDSERERKESCQRQP